MTGADEMKTQKMEELERKIYALFDVFRKQGIPTQHYYMMLYFLSLFKDGILSVDSLSHDNVFGNGRFWDSTMALKKGLENKPFEVRQYYLEIGSRFHRELDAIGYQGVSELLRLLSQVDKGFLTEHFPEIFDTILFRISKAQGRSGGEMLQPEEITRLMCGLVKLPEDAKVFNPFAGLASLGIPLKNHNYLGQEINRLTWALGVLRMKAYGGHSATWQLNLANSITHWPAKEKFDLVIAHPPFNANLNAEERLKNPGFKSIQEFFIRKGVASLNEKGKLIALLPQSFLSRTGEDKELRKFLIEEDLIDTVISLPGGLLANTSVPLCILIISNSKTNPERIRLVQGDSLIHASNSREKVLNDQDLLQALHSKEKNGNVRMVVNEQIIQMDYDLNVHRHFISAVHGVKLKELLEDIPWNRSAQQTRGRTVRIRDLKDDQLNFHLEWEQLGVSDIPQHFRRIEDSCLLLAGTWKNVKPTYFEYTGDPVFIAPEIFAFRVNEKRVDTAFLIHELHSNYVQQQVDAYRQHGVIPTLKKKDVLEVEIKLPSLNEQKAQIKGIVEYSEKIKLNEKKENAFQDSKIRNLFNDFASLKHTLGRPRQNILDWTDNLLHFFNENQEAFKELNLEFRNFYETDIMSALQEVKNDINFITVVLEKGEKGFREKDYHKSVISLIEVNKWIDELSSNGFKFKIKKNLLSGDKLNERGVLVNKTLLRTLLENILTNANKYAFDGDLEGNEVVIEMIEIDEMLSIEIRNNGKPFPKNFDREKFITKHSTADSLNGTGLGGYDINRIAAYFENEDWDLILNEPIYPVKFKFQFPIKLMS